MATPYTPEMERILRMRVDSEQRSLDDSFAQIAKRLRDCADYVERRANFAKEDAAATEDSVSRSYASHAGDILHELKWLMPNLPTDTIERSIRELVMVSATLQQMGALVTDDDRTRAAARQEADALVAQVTARLDAGERLKLRGVKVTEVKVAPNYSDLGFSITYRRASRKYARTATPEDIDTLKAGGNA